MRNLRIIFFTSFLFSVHLALLSYVNSTLLASHAGSNANVYFTLGSVFSIIGIFFVPSILRKFGNTLTVAMLSLLSVALLAFIGLHTNGDMVPLAFSVYFSLNILIVYGFDIFLEHYSQSVTTGRTRGLYQTINNIAWVLAPTLSGILIYKYGISSIYIIASVLVFLVFGLIVIKQRNFVDRHYIAGNIFSVFHKLQNNVGLRDIFVINFILQFFYSVMVINSPIFLQSLGLSWKEIGLVFSGMLLAFILIQYPAGRIADKIGEKKFLIWGLSICSMATLAFAFLPKDFDLSKIVFIAIILFFTRIGAALIEIMSDTYFFKRTSDSDTSVISAYRILFPIGYIFGPIVSVVFLHFFSYKILFIFLAILVSFGILFAKRIKE